MSIRHLVVTALMASACAAHADVIPSTDSRGTQAQSDLLSGWTAGNGGVDVIGAGVLSSNLSLIAGIAYGANDGLADLLFGSATNGLGLGQGDNGQARLFFTRGIEGLYLLGSGRGAMGAMLSSAPPGLSAIGTAAGGGLATAGAGGSATSTGTPRASAPVPATGSTTAGAGATGSAEEVPGAPFVLPTDLALLPQAAAVDAAVPEPSTGALLLAGLLGVGTFLRRRNTR
jgi:hypothetical protein